MRRMAILLLGAALAAAGCQSAPPPPPPPALQPAPPPPPPDPRDFSAAVYFETGSTALSESGRRELRDFAEKLEPFPERRLHVVGYRASAGPEHSERWLAERRAKVVAAYLVSRGIAARRVTLQGLEAPAPAALSAPPRSGRLAQVRVR